MKRIVIFFIIFLLFFNCENRKKKGILPAAKLEDLMILYFFTGGASIMNNCDIRYKYTVRKVNESVSGTDQVAISKYYSLKEGNYLYLRNSNSSSDCLVRASFTFCDPLNNQTIDWMRDQKICRNFTENYMKVTSVEKEKICVLNIDLLNQFSNSVIISVWSSNESANNIEICKFFGEMR